MKALEAWVARDDDGSRYMYTAKPKKKSYCWHAPKVGYVKLDDSLFLFYAKWRAIGKLKTFEGSMEFIIIADNCYIIFIY